MDESKSMIDKRPQQSFEQRSPKRLKPTCDNNCGFNNHYVQSQEPKSQADNRQILDHFVMDTANNTIDLTYDEFKPLKDIQGKTPSESQFAKKFDIFEKKKSELIWSSGVGFHIVNDTCYLRTSCLVIAIEKLDVILLDLHH